MDGLILTALVLGLVEGLTEFLPVSSTGHLILAGELLSFSGAKAATFEIFIQLGAILAVVVLYRRRFVSLVCPRERGGFAGGRGLLMLAVATLPGLVAGFLLHGVIKEHLFSPRTVAVGLAVGGLWILLAERFRSPPSIEGLDRLDWRRALAIGCFQCLALWPGMSRSSSTILGGMIAGLDRKTAAEFSFLAAVPLMAAATIYDMVRSFSCLTASDIPLFALGFAVAFVSALAAVKLFVRFVGHHTLAPFGWYRIAVALAVLAVLWR